MSTSALAAAGLKMGLSPSTSVVAAHALRESEIVVVPRLSGFDTGIRRSALSWRGARRMMLAVGVLGSMIAGAGLLAGRDRILIDCALDAARRENVALRARQEILTVRATDLAARLVTAELDLPANRIVELGAGHAFGPPPAFRYSVALDELAGRSEGLQLSGADSGTASQMR